MKVNVESVRNFLLHIRQFNPGTRVVYSSFKQCTSSHYPRSSQTQRHLRPEAHTERTNRRPRSSSTTCTEKTTLMCSPSASRPGAPNNATPSFLSGMDFEPMRGQECVLPLADRSYQTYICSPSSTIKRSATQALMPRLLSGISATIQQMVDALAKYGGKDKLKS
ncbi:hypothetical protein K461DRAFT_280941 [Myriangium duriaei CBS 260.36]|uniref:Uncharacterized protein n=1 Tax=Myriangium duriaei CBS 260.36 TaxID=1168546 RepID=A0A9P4IVT1_9PEZI|nr:hypothetical protein K461DRAFT_280941 [Myriangium duriaei CBS 260.36]